MPDSSWILSGNKKRGTFFDLAMEFSPTKLGARVARTDRGQGAILGDDTKFAPLLPGGTSAAGVAPVPTLNPPKTAKGKGKGKNETTTERENPVSKPTAGTPANPGPENKRGVPPGVGPTVGPTTVTVPATVGAVESSARVRGGEAEMESVV